MMFAQWPGLFIQPSTTDCGVDCAAGDVFAERKRSRVAGVADALIERAAVEARMRKVVLRRHVLAVDARGQSEVGVHRERTGRRIDRAAAGRAGGAPLIDERPAPDPRRTAFDVSATTVTVAVLESATPNALTRAPSSWSCAVSAGVVKLGDVAPAIGDDVAPLGPAYH